MHTEEFITTDFVPARQTPPKTSQADDLSAEHRRGPFTIEHIPLAHVHGLDIAAVSSDELCALVGHYIDNNQKRKFLYVNVHGINLCFRYPWLYEFLNQADVRFCDGGGLKMGAAMLGKNIPERITLADWVWQFAEYAEERAYSMFFLGSKPGVAEMAIESLKQIHPHISVAGFHHGYFDKAQSSSENQEVVRKINAAKPDMLWVGFGMPLQEKWLQDNWHDLDVKVAMTSGAMLEYIAGTTRRAPRWMNDNNLEWLGRLVIEPRRLWQRYVIGNPLYLARLLMRKSLP